MLRSALNQHWALFVLYVPDCPIQVCHTSVNTRYNNNDQNKRQETQKTKKKCFGVFQLKVATLPYGDMNGGRGVFPRDKGPVGLRYGCLFVCFFRTKEIAHLAYFLSTYLVSCTCF